MRIRCTALSVILALLIAPAQLTAKGDTVRITIRGGDLAAPIDIVDPQVMAAFSVWSGPGTSPNSPQGLIVDWSQGVAKPPRGLRTFEVSFMTSRPDHRAYVVTYAIDPATHQGYVFLPGKDDPRYWDNVWLIYRGIEGNWFYAWDAWDRVARRLIAAHIHQTGSQ